MAEAVTSWYQIKKPTQASEPAEVYIYGEIGAWGISAQQFAQDWRQLKKCKQIEVHLHSPGGSVFDGDAIYSMIKQSKADVTVYIDGWAASIASLIAMAGNSRKIASTGKVMIHNPSGGAYGDSAELRKAADLLDRVKATELATYAEGTGQTAEQISEWMDAETWFMGQEAVDAGFADELFDATEPTACFDATKFGFKSLRPEWTQVATEPAQAETEEEATTMADEHEAANAPAPVDTEKIRQEAVEAERHRTLTIRQAAFPGQDELVEKLIADGTDVTAAVLQLNQAFKQAGSAQLAAMATQSASIAVASTAVEKDTPKNLTRDEFVQKMTAFYQKAGNDPATAKRKAEADAQAYGKG